MLDPHGSYLHQAPKAAGFIWTFVQGSMIGSLPRSLAEVPVHGAPSESMNGSTAIAKREQLAILRPPRRWSGDEIATLFLPHSAFNEKDGGAGGDASTAAAFQSVAGTHTIEHEREDDDAGVATERRSAHQTW